MVEKQSALYSGLKDIQAKEFDVFQALLMLFEKYHLKYFITGGTVLGARYYKDFIPYDDDIDVCLSRKDYNLFLKKLYKEIPSPYLVEHYSLDEMFKYTIIRVENTSIDITEVSDPEKKVSHPSIDIAPLDGVPTNLLLRKLYFTRLLVLRGILTAYYSESINPNKDRSFKEKALISFLRMSGKVSKKLINPTKVKTSIDKILSKYDCQTSVLAGTYMGAYRDREMIPSKIWGRGKRYEFRGIKVRGPEDIEKYIKTVYGGFKELNETEAMKARHYVIRG